MNVTYNAAAFGMSPSAPLYISGQTCLNPDEKDINLHRFETWQIELKDGANQVDDHLIDLFKTHPSYNFYIDNNIVVLGGEGLAPSPSAAGTPEGMGKSGLQASEPVDITKISIKDATPLIKAEADISLLKQWENDPRTGIKDLVGDRLLELGEMPNV